MKIALIRGVVTIAELSNLDFQRLKNISGLRWNRTTRCMVGPVSLNLLDGLARYYKLPADMESAWARPDERLMPSAWSKTRRRCCPTR